MIVLVDIPVLLRARQTRSRWVAAAAEEYRGARSWALKEAGFDVAGEVAGVVGKRVGRRGSRTRFDVGAVDAVVEAENADADSDTDSAAPG